MAYTSINKSTDYFNTKTYTGTGSTNALTGVGFQPDFTWIKSRSNTYSHTLTDAVRGVTKHIASNNGNAEYTSTTEITSFDSDGFTVGTDAGVNNNGSTFASWNWKANGAGSSNTNGSITSTVSADTTSGFSIVKWTGSGSGEVSIGHGLGTTPKVVLMKNLGATGDWLYYTTVIDGTLDILRLNDTSTKTDSSATLPTNSLFYGISISNQSNDYIAYCFAEKTGFSKFGKYSGNVNLDGPFIYTGFKPAWVMIKCVGLANQSWTIFNNGLDSFNEMTNTLQANTNGAEDGNTTYNDIDFVSNGFKIREDNDNINATGQDYIYMAFAEAPIVGTNNIPATAR